MQLLKSRKSSSYCRQLDKRAKRRNRGFLMCVCGRQQILQKTLGGFLFTSLCCGHSATDQWFRLTAFQHYHGVGKHQRGWTGTVNHVVKRWSSYAASETTTLSHAVLFCSTFFSKSEICHYRRL